MKVRKILKKIKKPLEEADQEKEEMRIENL